MKSLIITCGCLEPSKDGIGDYSFNLAKAVKLLGVRVVLVSVNDSFVKVFREENREDIQICRIPAQINWQQKYRTFKNICDTVSPDHISFQYVIYAYHKKGLPIVAHKFLVEALKSHQVSIMMHEPWIGRSKEDLIRHKIIGYFQQIIIKQLINGIAPIRVFTSNRAFSDLLSKSGIRNKVLPLFSNIPFCENALDLIPMLIHGKQFIIPERSTKILLFGRIPFAWKKREFLNWIGKREISLLVAGRSDQDNAKALENELKNLKSDLNIFSFGELDKIQISALLQYADAGLALTPPQILGKSGVVAAYREHGLPIILAGEDESFSTFNDPHLIDEISLDIPWQQQENKFRRKKTYNGVHLTAEMFLDTIKKVEIQQTTLA
ncbi:hypothetical protein [Zunongwangia sp. HGR-M22]|uniref:hypothetical protein n=1 Tax=Zunongwangia sp. HGR-M22 TaxID=3015168 RepID=UPI0022DE2B77|nr:hypothetical protein [Zunongwangia sp. HGR-M22]WBL26395.1 hypothetical protein PBT91_03765 [Zunongwangia sp. HGR-M22]